MPDYSQGKVYKILNTETDDVYVGSTTGMLCRRLSKHKAEMRYRTNSNMKLYAKMKEHGEDTFYIELIENYPCGTKEELNAREGYWIRQFGTLNKIVQGRTPKEYYQDNMDSRKEYHHHWYTQNKDKPAEKAK